MFGDEKEREERIEGAREREREGDNTVPAAHLGRLLRYMRFTQIHKANIKATAAGDSPRLRGENMSGQKLKAKR